MNKFVGNRVAPKGLGSGGKKKNEEK